MTLRLLAIDRFRNLEPQRVILSPGLNLFVGDNAQGKSNFLEAVSLVSMARSFRQSPNSEMIRFGEEQASVEAELGEAAQAKSLRLALDRRFKYAFVNRQRVGQMADYLGEAPPAVVFRSESLAIGRGAPELRRQFLDQLLVNSSPPNLVLLRRYQRALVQRNTALRQGWNAAEMAGFESELAQTGWRIVELRRRLVTELGRLAAEFQKEFREELQIRYETGLEDYDGVDSLYAALREAREQDRRQGSTRLGPHRDDLEMSLEGASVRRYGSQGQVRSVVLSFKVAEIEILAHARGQKPLLILDDVSADLDESRREKLFDYVAKDLQAFVSTTEANTLGLRPDRYSRFEVKAGKLSGP